MGIFRQGRPRPEPGDLVGLPLDVDLAEHYPGGLVEHRQQVQRLPIGRVVTGATQRLAVHRQSSAGTTAASRSQPVDPVTGLERAGQPGTDRRIEGVGVHLFEDPADRGLIWWFERPGQRVTADPERGQDLRRSIQHPFTDCGEPARTGQYCRGGQAEQRHQGMADTSRITRVGHPRQIGQQTRAPAGQQLTIGSRQISEPAQSSVGQG
jgi:hypothetical protein